MFFIVCFLTEPSYRGKGIGKEVTRMMMCYGEAARTVCQTFKDFCMEMKDFFSLFLSTVDSIVQFLHYICKKQLFYGGD